MRDDEGVLPHTSHPARTTGQQSKRVTACCRTSRPSPPTSPHLTPPHPLRRYMVGELVRKGIPVITPAGGLGVHVDAMRFVDHIPQIEVGCRQLGQGQLFAMARQCWCSHRWPHKEQELPFSSKAK